MNRLPAVTDAPSYWQLISSQHGRLAFDIGANIGQAARVLAANFERVVSFEPCTESLAVLAAEAPANVWVSDLAVSASAGPVELDETEHAIATGQLTTGSHLGWGPVTGRRTVQATTVDDQTGQWGVPDLVKVDTEGHEPAVLRGATATLRERRTVWLVEVHDRSDEQPILEAFAGYRVRRWDHDYLLGSDQAADHFYLHAVPA